MFSNRRRFLCDNVLIALKGMRKNNIDILIRNGQVYKNKTFDAKNNSFQARIYECIKLSHVNSHNIPNEVGQ